MEELKKCPFCGDKYPKITIKNDIHCRGADFETVYAMQCEICGCQTKFFSRPSLAVEAWNKRKNAAKVVRGKWVYKEDEDETTCSNCGIRIPEMYSNADSVLRSECRFCHYCGAKMDGERRTDT